MRKYIALTRLNFFALLSTFSGGSSKSKKRAASGIGSLLLICFLGVYLSGIYSFMFAAALAPAGMISLVPTLMAAMSFIMSLMFTCFAASGIVFGNKDSDLMLSLPLSAFSIMLSKILSLYLENLVFTIFMMAPAGFVYLYFGGDGGTGFVVRLLIASLFLPLIATILALLVGFLLALLQAKLGRNALLGNLSYLLFFGFIMVFSFQVNTMVASLVQNSNAVNGFISNWLLPLALFSDGIYGNITALLGFIAITLLPFLLIVFLMSMKYKKILTMLTSTKTRSDYKLGEMKTDGLVLALFKKEFGRFWGTPIYVFNTGFGVLMVIIAAVAGVIYKSAIMNVVLQMGGSDVVYPVLLIALSFLCIMTCSSSVSISLEGKTLWILKEAPIATKFMFLPKALVNMTLIWAIGIVATPAAIYVLEISLSQAFALLSLCFSLGLFVSFSGLVINLLFPKMDGTNDTLIVKQSASVLLSMLAGMLTFLLGAGFYLLLSPIIGSSNAVIAFSVIIILFSILLWKYLMSKGATMLQKI